MGLTQEQFANEFNKKYNYSFTKSTISNYENNFRTPEMNVLKKLAEMMNLSIDYLLDNSPKNLESISDFQFALYEGTKNLTEEQKKAIKTIIDGFNQKGK